MKTQTEKELLYLCLKDDRRAQKALYDLYSPKLYTSCLRLLKSQDDASDALQEGFIKIFRNLQQFTGEGSLEGWMRRIMFNVCMEVFRKKKYHVDLDYCEESDSFGGVNNLPSTRNDGLSNLGVKDLLKKVANMAHGYKTVFTLYNEGFGHKEIGELLHISEATSKSQYSRAKQKLREQL